MSAPVLSHDGRSGSTPGIVHFGVGGFHRAHQAAYLDRLMAAGRASSWGIVGVGVQPGDRRMQQALASQDHLFTLMELDPDGSIRPTTIGSILDFKYAPDDPGAVVDLLSDAAIRIVSLTITEGGYHVHSVTGELDTRDADLAADLAGTGQPRTVFGFVTAALQARRATGTKPFTVMSCDNLPGNGDIARRMITAFAERLDPDLAAWIGDEVAFPNSMVDRITPATSQDDIDRLAAEHGIEDAWPVVCEPFTQWVLQDRFSDGRPPLEEVGVQLVDDVEPYELMKLRMLNCGHQAIAYLGYLAGHRYAHEVCQDELFADFLRGYLRDEAESTLPEVPGVDLAEHRESLVQRFSHPAMKDPLSRLCAQASDRIPRWLVPVIRENLAAGRSIKHCATIVAGWARYAEGVDESGAPIEVVDRRSESLTEAAGRHDHDLLAFLRDPDLFGDLVEHEQFTTAYQQALAGLRDTGARATVTALQEVSP